MFVGQTRRIEYKYIVNDAKAAALRNEIRRFMRHDPYGDGHANHAYPIYSLYLDTRNDPIAYWEKIEGLPVRQKIRIRTYTARHSRNVLLFLESKQKHNDVIYKLRQPITIDQYKLLTTDPYLLFKKNLSPFVSNITNTVITNRLIPYSYICFNREAFVDPSRTDIRINLDYQILGAWEKTLFTTGSTIPLASNQVILEIKFWRTVPLWLHDIIRWYQLQRIPFSKYCQSIAVRDTVSDTLSK